MEDEPPQKKQKTHDSQQTGAAGSEHNGSSDEDEVASQGAAEAEIDMVRSAPISKGDDDGSNSNSESESVPSSKEGGGGDGSDSVPSSRSHISVGKTCMWCMGQVPYPVQVMKLGEPGDDDERDCAWVRQFTVGARGSRRLFGREELAKFADLTDLDTL